MAILISVFCMGYGGKTVDFERCSPHHRTTLAYFHQSHLKGTQDYGHQAVAVMLSCNGIILNYVVIMYDKFVSNIDIVNKIAQELPQPPVLSYFLCDSWYPSEKLINTFIQKGFYTIAALKTNRILYAYGIKSKLSDYAQKLSENKQFFHLVTVKGRQYYVHRYEGKVNKLGNAVVLISYPKEAFGNPNALRTFLCTNVGLETQDILERYTSRWPIEIFFSSK